MAARSHTVKIAELHKCANVSRADVSDLLAALKDLRAMIIGEHGASAYENVNGERADAAIAKAEGRS